MGIAESFGRNPTIGCLQIVALTVAPPRPVTHSTAGKLFDNAPTDPRSMAWGYDASGNRTSSQAGADSTLTQALPTTTNALFSLRGGALRIAGTLSKPARQVQVNGQAAQVSPADKGFLE